MTERMRIGAQRMQVQVKGRKELYQSGDPGHEDDGSLGDCKDHAILCMRPKMIQQV